MFEAVTVTNMINLANEQDFYSVCALTAMSALINKVPLADREQGDDPDAVIDEICRSADGYAITMVQMRRARKQEK